MTDRLLRYSNDVYAVAGIVIACLHCACIQDTLVNVLINLRVEYVHVCVYVCMYAFFVCMYVCMYVFGNSFRQSHGLTGYEGGFRSSS